ncbi:carboxypeptidase-like regulatory domain-containing protein [Plebeiibacterium sediminum]|uniref:Carboxypeptidase-like regulatory domain-containing protein n=1 Tax=Plebeiibacterium sediminum TaxID=2992112 RepID=A0AAE3SES2_9BACT|nr:carboxypeptidase-like regulatory domain-containing protein [Plebeiobacterium sediminum]MCW3786690.1 carboxypeptidase-like regulatory domain-containing protein [Plebeiobacterium sediminum]
MKNLFILILLLTISTLSLAESFCGKIIDSKTLHPIPFVNISLKGTYSGTVSDANGRYKLMVPNKSDYIICFSCIGYQSVEISYIQLKEKSDIILTPSITPLNEIVIMPDSTLRSFLSKAYNKIADNYPKQPTTYEVFHRSGLQNGDKDYIRLNEVLLNAYKSSYDDKTEGTVSIIKTRKYIEPNQSNEFQYVYYGAVYDIHHDDLIKNRRKYLKPDKNYDYELYGVEYYNNRKVYVIDFKPKVDKKLKYKGKIFIDAKTLGYLKIELSPTEQWLKERYNDVLGLHSNIKAEDFDFVVNYSIKDSVFYYQSSYYKEKINHRDSTYYFVDENVVTSVQIDEVNKIPFNQQVPITYVPTIEAKEYSKSDWKDYATIPDAIKIDTTTKELFISPSPKPTTKQMIQKLMTKMEFTIGIRYFANSIEQSKIDFNYQHLSFNKEINQLNASLNFDETILYKLNKRNGIGYQLNFSLSKAFRTSNNCLYYNYRIPVKTIGRNIFINLSTGYSWLSLEQSLGTKNSNTNFKFGGKKFKNNKVQAYSGLKINGLTFGSDIEFQFSNIFHLVLSTNYISPIKTVDIITLQERSGFFLFRKHASEPISNKNIDYFINDIPSNKSGMKFNNWSFGIGFKMKI